ncbi:DMT family transporter [Pediococcus pentosaceus]|jgi:small multidrug resistance pump|uniref:DMT family transporter n=1 Tax=Pediococcus pentosaceus TaxID=1255 RepID=UPI0011547253|nr:multidrug efflux SMR transporter [Pediococcus pentosaceus]MBF7109790.1 multidrug efflux SMR transporter [Pediococcus pentosaceus]MDN4853813.1 multidrug efflux SMR transporter [Pediococcus pentosaceus]MEB3377395.1 multidrug efflux SMR transporter [Pediococcus pentosaceus]QDJ24275.1 QacE family quaternary ammonium compound efflux SMR transporter [Pediococcus pentosaceus]QQA93083.1 multidrug efflux SMR transporter [Pediococcus pentosaceus]
MLLATYLKRSFYYEWICLFGYVYLLVAIVAELLGTNFLKLTNGFTKLLPTLISLLSYGFAFYFLSLVVKNIPINIAYAIWSGVGIILMTVISVFVFHNPINVPTVLGILFITLGVILVNLFGVSH